MSKRHFAVLAGAFVLFAGTAALAQAASAPPASPAPVQQINTAQVQQDLAPLATAFGVKVEPAAPAPAEPAPTTGAGPTEKTMAGVADRALDMVENVTVTISNTLKTMAPEVWRIMIRQQYAKAVAGPLGPLGWIISALVLLGFGRKVWPHLDGADYVQGNGEAFNNVAREVVLKALPIAVCTIATLFLIGEIRNSILYLVNPEYYAIKDLLEAIMSAKAAAS